MIRRVRVLHSASKHGYSEDEVAYAWCNYDQDSKDRNRDGSVHARIGHTSSGTMLELIGSWEERDREWLVFHAMRPGKKLIKQLGLEV